MTGSLTKPKLTWRSSASGCSAAPSSHQRRTAPGGIIGSSAGMITSSTLLSHAESCPRSRRAIFITAIAVVDQPLGIAVYTVVELAVHRDQPVRCWLLSPSNTTSCGAPGAELSSAAGRQVRRPPDISTSSGVEMGTRRRFAAPDPATLHRTPCRYLSPGPQHPTLLTPDRATVPRMWRQHHRLGSPDRRRHYPDRPPAGCGYPTSVWVPSAVSRARRSASSVPCSAV